MILKDKIIQFKKELDTTPSHTPSNQNENKVFTILATLAATFVVVTVFIFLLYFFTLKMECDQHWATIENSKDCFLLEQFIQQNPSCPQVKEAEYVFYKTCSK